MANPFDKGAEAILAAASSKRGGKFTRKLYWTEDDKKYIQFITPLSEVPRVPHYLLKVGTREDDGGPIYRDFIDPRPYDGDEAYNPVRDRWPEIKPKDRMVAVAVELEPKFKTTDGRKKINGFKVATHSYTKTDEDGNEEEVEAPNVGVIIDSHLFFKWLTSYEENSGPIEDAVFLVEQKDKAKDKSYAFIPFNDAAIELPEDVLSAVDLDAFLADLASPDRYHEWIDPLPDNYILDMWAQKKGAKNKAASKGRGKVSRVVETDDDDDADDADADFQALKKKITGGD